ncbi:hypothetical protein MPH_01437 [Macrophomina phaseolina MS6]|uniref:Uncharacterized protein n=1 Tax=Macrophomina phaseolina (strain MS6) TaxID=1126212 RepID=K2SX95_MACPH|nr:hypothetical protein MPH_01437 [Macrophomina phaseolina MS6]
MWIVLLYSWPPSLHLRFTNSIDSPEPDHAVPAVPSPGASRPYGGVVDDPYGLSVHALKRGRAATQRIADRQGRHSSVGGIHDKNSRRGQATIHAAARGLRRATCRTAPAALLRRVAVGPGWPYASSQLASDQTRKPSARPIRSERSRRVSPSSICDKLCTKSEPPRRKPCRQLI